MKGTSPQSSQADESHANNASNDSDDERWEDKLVIDLDANNMSASDSKLQIKAAASDTVESDTTNSKTKEQTSVLANKNGRVENNPLGKPKGKRGGQKKAAENSKNESTNSSTAKVAGKAVKADKEKSSGAKPGRKKKEKQPSPAPKSELGSQTDTNSEDPYKFDPTDEKISGTVMGKTNGKTKNKNEQKSMKDAQTEYDWRSVASITEPEHLGPCEPGTQVCLEGIVWQETNNGVLVVNVTWKGKTYMGTLLDATKHDWSPPSCDSPTGDFEGRTPKGRGKRSRVPLSDTFKDINERKLRKEMRKQSGQNQARPKSPATPPKSENGKRKGRSSECETSEPTPKRGRGGAAANPHSPPALIECPEPNCGKKYKQMNGLKYHQRNAHQEGSPQVSSDATSEGADKTESVSSPEEPCKTKSNKKSVEAVEEVNKSGSSSDSVKASAVRNNTTSVITPTTSSLPSTTTPQSGIVPVAAITPQVVKPNNTSTDSSEQPRSNSANPPLTSTANRTMAITAPPKLISKSSVNNSSMAPISTITSPSAYNSSLPNIQPKPTIWGAITSNPGLDDLMNQKKLKRKRSASKEDLFSPPVYSNLDTQKPTTGGMYKFDTEHRGLLSTGGMINAAEPPNVLQSPSYSDISEEGEIKNARRELLSAGRNESGGYAQPPYLVATVSPQKNAPTPDKESKKHLNRQTPSHSPISSRTLEDKQKRLEFLHSPWAAMNPSDLMQMQMLKSMQNGNSKEKTGNGESPKTHSFKASGPLSMSGDADNRASNDRLQLLKENMDMKTSPMLPRHGMNEAPCDYSLSPNPPSQQSSDYMMYQAQKNRELEQEHQKRELMKNLSPANKMSSSGSGKMTDNRYEKMARSSPLPRSGSFVPPFMANAFLPFANLAAVANPMLSRGLAPPFLPTGFNYPAALANLPMDSKDTRNSTSPSFGAKSGHKIHELEGMQSSKSPRPASSGERQLSSKNQPITSQSAALHPAAAAAMLGSYGPPHGLHPSMAALFPPPK